MSYEHRYPVGLTYGRPVRKSKFCSIARLTAKSLFANLEDAD